MAWKSAGLRVLRWVLWLFVGLMFVRGVFTTIGPAPPAEPVAAKPAEPVQRAEPAGLRSFPALFAYEYLTWKPGQPDERAGRLKPYLAPGLEQQAGWSPGKEGTGQDVEGAWVHGIRSLSENRWLVTVAARAVPYQTASPASQPAASTGSQTLSADGRRTLAAVTLYLSVPVAATAAGGWAVYDFPALVSGPAAGEVKGGLLDGSEVSDKDDKIRTLAAGFFQSYFGGGGDSSYYLAPGTRIAAAPNSWKFEGVPKVALADKSGERRALADVQVADPATGAQFTFRYYLQLVERDGRWYIKDMLQKGE